MSYPYTTPFNSNFANNPRSSDSTNDNLIKQLSENNSVYREKLIELRNKSDSLNAELFALRQRVTTVHNTSEIQTLSSKNEELQKLITSLNNSIEDKDRENDLLRKKVRDSDLTTTDLETAKVVLNRLQTKRSSLTLKYETLQKEFNQYKITKNEEMKKIMANVNYLQKMVE
ncbi:hypothetical protein EIN_095860 [Entamoeba invadens IP1]|uniref:Uncharacterized protein n=1 Tax=Entamoeba invadens IP1 TaxID=370355 RepID=A0A0A1U0C6_ENTIV|nr:hypothetical protein EIN_095860 [Entamoeba invadens IP1]ELP87329.1 hypothetical protein EIN_095860 [Entamoeba invadens IP1]|eukprot:XP_004254100.1 hypothetical protein EIN_095860 [Entamoeba invadens IP1]